MVKHSVALYLHVHVVDENQSTQTELQLNKLEKYSKTVLNFIWYIINLKSIKLKIT